MNPLFVTYIVQEDGGGTLYFWDVLNDVPPLRAKDDLEKLLSRLQDIVSNGTVVMIVNWQRLETEERGG